MCLWNFWVCSGSIKYGMREFNIKFTLFTFSCSCGIFFENSYVAMVRTTQKPNSSFVFCFAHLCLCSFLWTRRVTHQLHSRLLWCSGLCPALLRRPSIASSLARREFALLWLRISFVMFIFEFQLFSLALKPKAAEWQLF